MFLKKKNLKVPILLVFLILLAVFAFEFRAAFPPPLKPLPEVKEETIVFQKGYKTNQTMQPILVMPQIQEDNVDEMGDEKSDQDAQDDIKKSYPIHLISPEHRQNETNEPLPIGYQRFQDRFEEDLAKEGLERSLAARIIRRLRNDFKLDQSQLNLREMIRSELGEKANDQQIQKLYEIALLSVQEAFQQQIDRSEVQLSDPTL